MSPNQNVGTLCDQKETLEMFWRTMHWSPNGLGSSLLSICETLNTVLLSAPEFLSAKRYKLIKTSLNTEILKLFFLYCRKAMFGYWQWRIVSSNKIQMVLTRHGKYRTNTFRFFTMLKMGIMWKRLLSGKRSNLFLTLLYTVCLSLRIQLMNLLMEMLNIIESKKFSQMRRRRLTEIHIRMKAQLLWGQSTYSQNLIEKKIQNSKRSE